MAQIYEYLGMVPIYGLEEVTTTVTQIILAAVCGALIGMDRGRKHRPAGIRTHMLVCIASALVMVTNEHIAQAYGADPGRLGAQVISGIGFLGAGTILTDSQNRIRGLTSAAGLWATACVGLAIGSGFYLGGVLTSLLIVLIFTKLIKVEKHVGRKSRTMEIRVSFENAASLMNFISELTSHDCTVASFELEGKEASLQIELPEKNHNQVQQIFENCPGMIRMEEI